MNLMKLLKVGRSLEDGKTILGKYKLTQQSLMPKFASTTRPSKATPIMPLPAAEPKLEMEVLSVPDEMKKEEPPFKPEEPACVLEPTVERRPVEADKTQKIPVGTVLKRVEEKAVLISSIRFSTRIKQNISSLWKKWWPARSRRKGGMAPVQTEWALEKIKVARNDLNDADLEIVARKAASPPPQPKAKPSFAEANRGKHHGHRWIKMTVRLFKRTSPFEQPAERVQVEAVKQSELAGRI